LSLEPFPSVTDIELFLRYSLKAQSQCRQTLETRANLKNPRTVAFMQTNIAENIQVNNAQAPPDRSKSAQGKPLGLKMANDWILNRKSKQATAIRRCRPWEYSTGPKSAAGKARVARNSYKTQSDNH
jgi:hypothetical protein